MKTNMQTSSLDAYDRLKATGTLCKQSDLIMAKLEHNRNYTLREIQVLTNLEINVVSGRINDLKKAGKLEHTTFKRNCIVTGKLVQPVKLPSKQLDLLEAA